MVLIKKIINGNNYISKKEDLNDKDTFISDLNNSISIKSYCF